MLASCVARVAPNKSVDNRHKWCNKRCTHVSAHAPLGEPSDYIVIHLYKPEARAHPDYLEFATPAGWTHLSGPDKRAFHQAAFDKRLAEAAVVRAPRVGAVERRCGLLTRADAPRGHSPRKTRATFFGPPKFRARNARARESRTRACRRPRVWW